MDICKKLQMAKRDEAGGILEYNKLKNSMPAEHTEHVDTIDNIIGDEYDHLQDIEKMMQEMSCKGLTAIEEICIIAKEIHERANEIGRTAKTIENRDIAEKIYKVAENVERAAKEIDTMAKGHIK